MTIMKKKMMEVNLSQEFSLFILDMANKKSNKFSTWKKKKPLERKVADDLVKQSEKNELLRQKNIGKGFLDLF